MSSEENLPWHYNDKTGKTDRCRARKGGCPFKDSNDPNLGHYSTEKELLDYMENRAESELGSQPANLYVSPEQYKAEEYSKLKEALEKDSIALRDYLTEGSEEISDEEFEIRRNYAAELTWLKQDMESLDTSGANLSQELLESFQERFRKAKALVELPDGNSSRLWDYQRQHEKHLQDLEKQGGLGYHSPLNLSLYLASKKLSKDIEEGRVKNARVADSRMVEASLRAQAAQKALEDEASTNKTAKLTRQQEALPYVEQNWEENLNYALRAGGSLSEAERFREDYRQQATALAGAYANLLISKQEFHQGLKELDKDSRRERERRFGKPKEELKDVDDLKLVNLSVALTESEESEVDLSNLKLDKLEVLALQNSLALQGVDSEIEQGKLYRNPWDKSREYNHSKVVFSRRRPILKELEEDTENHLEKPGGKLFTDYFVSRTGLTPKDFLEAEERGMNLPKVYKDGARSVLDRRTREALAGAARKHLESDLAKSGEDGSGKYKTIAGLSPWKLENLPEDKYLESRRNEVSLKLSERLKKEQENWRKLSFREKASNWLRGRRAPRTISDVDREKELVNFEEKTRKAYKEGPYSFLKANPQLSEM